MRILLTNDDGIDAPGLAALEKAVRSHHPDALIFVVAPLEAHSGCGHRVTVDRPLEIHPRAPGRWAVAGTPADCTRVARARLVEEIDLVIAGINEGGNLGVDIFMSGTVAAAREASLLGIPAVALSQYYDRETGIDWDRTTAWARHALEHVSESHRLPGAVKRSATCPPAPLLNINFPRLPAGASLPPIIDCPMDDHPLHVDFQPDPEAGAGDSSSERVTYVGDYHSRPRAPETDVSVCMGGAIALSQLTPG